jgi:muconolactone delta-isomerase
MTFPICDSLKKTKFVRLGATWKMYLGELAQHDWRQHLWDQTGYFGNGGFLAHPNSTETEDE